MPARPRSHRNWQQSQRTICNAAQAKTSKPSQQLPLVNPSGFGKLLNLDGLQQVIAVLPPQYDILSLKLPLEGPSPFAASLVRDPHGILLKSKRKV
jgi:hypothetical protein